MKGIYQTNLGLLTDLYQITMAYGYWKSGRKDEEAVFNLFFRKNPFGGQFAVAAGLETAIAFIEAFHFDEEDLVYLGTLIGNNRQPLFEQAFLDFLAELRFEGNLHAIPEGTLVFPHEPMLRFTGPIILGQLLETPLLNMLNFQTLIASKAARICQAAEGDDVLEFGLRRAQGIDGALSASRAAYVGGCTATSNVLAGKLFGIPVRGTHAHSWIMSYSDELEAFQAYAKAMPGNCVFLVDTYDTLEGVRNAVTVGQKLRNEGYEMIGIRLDSGDLTQLSIQARTILDEAGFDQALIVASNDLDEHEITRLKGDGATINVWGIGTRLVTGNDQPALGGVYKLAATRVTSDDSWRYCVKHSEEPIKVSNPGVQNVRRIMAGGVIAQDIIYEEGLGCAANGEGADLLVEIFRDGQCVYDLPSLDSIRENTLKNLQVLPGGEVLVSLDPALEELKSKLINQAGHT